MTDATTIATFAQQMIAAGEMFHSRGWVPATGGNFSVRLDAEQVLITASGNHKGELREAHFLVATLDGKPREAGRKASYETLLHMQIYQRVPEAKAVLHVHTTANTLLSRRFDQIVLTNYELLKVLPKQVILALPVQFLEFKESIKKQLEAVGRKVTYFQSKHGKFPGQILGCDVHEFKAEGEFLYVGDGDRKSVV